MNKKKIIASILSLVLITGTFASCGNSSVPGKKNEDELNEPAEGISIISDEEKTTLPEVTAITAGVDVDGNIVDKEGIVDNSGHKIYRTGETDSSGNPIYTTGKKATNGRILYTKNLVNSFGDQIYYTGFYKDGKLVLTETTETPDYTTNDKPSKYTTKATTKMSTIGYESTSKLRISDLKSNYIKYFGGTSFDFIRSVTACKDGGYAVTCFTDSKDGNLKGANDEWSNFSAVAKFSADGTLLWRYMLGGDGLVVFDDITELKDESIIAVGSTAATDTDAPKNCQSVSSIIVRLNKNGELIWMYTLPGSMDCDSDEASSVCATPDGGFVVGGRANSTAGFFNGGSGNVAYLFKFDKNCNLKWRRTLSGSKSNDFAAVDVADNGDIYATCVTTSTDGDFASMIKSKGYAKNTVLVKLNKSGDLQWRKLLDSSGNSEYNGVCATDDGAVVVGTYYVNRHADGVYTGSYGKSDIMAIRYNKNGDVNWARHFGGSGDDYAFGVTEIDNGFAIVGYTNSTDHNFVGYANGGKEDGYVMILNEEGECSATFGLDGSDSENVLGVCTLNNGTIIAAGWTQSNDNTFRSSGAKQAKGFVMNFSTVTEEKKTTVAKK